MNRNNLDISAQKLFFKRPSPSNDRKISNPPIKVKSPTITARCIKSDFFLGNHRDKKPRINKTRPRHEGINDVNDLLSLVTLTKNPKAIITTPIDIVIFSAFWFKNLNSVAGMAYSSWIFKLL